MQAPDFQLLSESIPQLLWQCDAHQQGAYLSPQWCSYTGTSAETQLGSRWLEQIHPDDRAPMQTAWAQATQASEAFDVELRLRGKDGNYRRFKNHAVPLRDDQGRLSGWCGSSTDVEELRQAQEQLQRDNATELRRAHEQLEDAQRLAQTGSWEWDFRTDRVEWSRQLFEIFGLDPADGPPPFALHAPLFAAESWELLRRHVDNCLHQGQEYALELEICRPDRRACWAVARGRPKHDESGQICKLQGTLQDITERKLAQLKLQRSSQRIHLATEAAGIGIWELDLRSNLLEWDATMHRLYGRSAGDFDQQCSSWQAHLHPEDAPATLAALNEALSGGQAYDASFRIRRGDGQIRHLRGKAEVHFGPGGDPQRAIGVNWDVSEQEQILQALRDSQRLLSEFVRYVPAALAMFDKQMHYLEVSQRWLTDFGLEGQELIGRSHYDVFPDLPERWKAVHQRVFQGQVERCAEDTFVRADGKTEWLEWELRPWLTSQGEVAGLFIFSQFITSRKQLELKLEKQRLELKRSNHDLEQFAFSASHDLQEPLRAIAGCVQILERRYESLFDAAGKDLVAHVTDGVRRLQGLIRDLLAYSRAGEAASFGWVDSRQIVEKVIELLQLPADQIEVSDLPDCCWADASLLSQIFQNLLTNSLKYRSQRPLRIRISAIETEQGWEFSVSDNGIGIDPQHFAKIFLVFQRLHGRNQYPGTGIGLALCQKLVRHHGGRIWVESQPGEGATFHFTLSKGEQP